MRRAREHPSSAYAAGLRALAGREVSTEALRARLLERFEADEVASAIDRLTAEGALNDRRTAAAYARTAVSVKRRGRLRIVRELEARGIARDLAEQVTNDAMADADEPQLLERALARALKGGALDQRARRRVYASLVRQGFPPDLVVAALRAHRAAPADE